MNRRLRRALGRIKNRVEHPHRKIPSQRCALWVPAARGYLADFSSTGFHVVEYAEFAHHYEEDEAARVALAFRERTGLRVAVRPVHLQPSCELTRTLLDAR